MHDYGSEGFSFYKDNDGNTIDFVSIGEAIACAMEIGYSSKFIIVSVVDCKKLVLEIDLIKPNK